MTEREINAAVSGFTRADMETSRRMIQEQRRPLVLPQRDLLEELQQAYDRRAAALAQEGQRQGPPSLFGIIRSGLGMQDRADRDATDAMRFAMDARWGSSPTHTEAVSVVASPQTPPAAPGPNALIYGGESPLGIGWMDALVTRPPRVEPQAPTPWVSQEAVEALRRQTQDSDFQSQFQANWIEPQTPLPQIPPADALRLLRDLAPQTPLPPWTITLNEATLRDINRREEPPPQTVASQPSQQIPISREDLEAAWARLRGITERNQTPTIPTSPIASVRVRDDGNMHITQVDGAESVIGTTTGAARASNDRLLPRFDGTVTTSGSSSIMFFTEPTICITKRGEVVEYGGNDAGKKIDIAAVRQALQPYLKACGLRIVEDRKVLVEENSRTLDL